MFLAPELLRNEPLFVTNNQQWAIITSRHLHTVVLKTQSFHKLHKFQDPDTGPEIRYLVFQPSGGYVAAIDNQDEPLLSFTQQAVNARQIGFVIKSGESSS